MEALAVELFTVHSVDGRPIQVNPIQITRLINPRGDEANIHVAPGVKCIIMLTDGGFVTVVEDCDDVRKAVEKTR